MRLCAGLFFYVALFVPGTSVVATDRIANEESACDAVRHTASRDIGLRSRSDPNKWWCAASGIRSEFLVLALRSGGACEPPGTTCSTLIGYFAVRQSDGTVYGWDIAEDKLGERIPK